jgi:hypothetical protein
MRLSIGFGLVLAFACSSIGCGNNPLPPGGDLGQGNDLSAGSGDMSANLDMATDMVGQVLVSYSQYAMDYANTFCAREQQCGKLGNDAASLANCVQRNILALGVDLDTEIAKGRLKLNELQCLQGVSNARCDGSDFGFVRERCGAFLFAGQQNVNDACIDDRECINSQCAHTPVDPDGGTAATPLPPSGCPGTCQPFLSTGATCTRDSQCNSAVAYCPRNSHMCTPKFQLGNPCQRVLKPCASGLFCSSFTAVCQTPVSQMSLGGACDPDQATQTAVPPCAPGLYCQLQYTSGVASGGTCQKKLGAGVTCHSTDVTGFTFEDNPCDDGYYCYQTAGVDGSGQESCQLPLAAGSSCDPNANGFLSFCFDGHACAGATPTCQLLSPNGTTCPSLSRGSQVCGSGVCGAANPDAGVTGQCSAIKGFGASCVPGLDDNICVPAEFDTSVPPKSQSHCAPSGNGGTCAPKCF